MHPNGCISEKQNKLKLLSEKGAGKSRHRLNLNEVILQSDDGTDRKPFSKGYILIYFALTSSMSNAMYAPPGITPG